MVGGLRLRIQMESPESPDECCRHLEGAFGGRLRFSWSSFSRASDSDRIVGRIDGNHAVATLISGTTAPISFGRFGRQVLSVRIRPNGAGSAIAGSIHYPILDRAIYSVVLGLVALLVTRDSSLLLVGPVLFGCIWAYENVISPDRARSDAEALLRTLATAVEGRVSGS